MTFKSLRIRSNQFMKRNKTRKHRSNGQKYEWNCHRKRRFMRRMMIMGFLSPEYIIIKPEHIKCCEPRYQIYNCEYYFTMMKCSYHYFILTEKGRKWRKSTRLNSSHANISYAVF